MSKLPSVVVKPSRQFPFVSRHPWVHASSLAESSESFPLGQEVDLVQHDGTWLARGLFNPNSGLRVRLYSWNRQQSLDEAFFRTRIDQAIARRRLAGLLPAAPHDSDSDGSGTLAGVTTAARLVFSESDGLSGLIVDQYADCLVVQIAAGVIALRQTALLEHLQQRLQPRAIFLRTDAKTAKKEGIEQQEGLAKGEASEEPILYDENGLRWSVDLEHGQKTGGYLDQRDNHAAAAKYLTGRRVLDVCCYAGGFGLVAASHDASSVTGIDSSQRALDAAAANAQRNGLKNVRFEKADCFDYLAADATEQFDAVVLDPPRFAGSRRQVDAALRAYARLNRGALERLPAGGVLVTNSCSGSVSRSDFLNMLVNVGRRAGRDITVLESRSAAADHPMRVSCPESDYLKCFICEVQ
ncbi:class I SAM-dependent rRNA methyltransferase [Roseimaritima ulvae]|uniref:Ribosomal RNA large subunit methyltransferase I n=1 Tax=Roseimaritima ulvae TaxID=980254 RepID=A0A5B9R7Y1_9BACT|nr:class I SAM-dependent rRNA methyltransferase [Roseimaritima ulvae]QEG42841.1 Ribosomal RNA large subunit methyltransferase I [Roseimaritima ulvae]